MKLKEIEWKEKQSFADLPHRWEGFVEGLHLFSFYQNDQKCWFLETLFPIKTYPKIICCYNKADCQQRSKTLLKNLIGTITDEN